MRRLASSPTNQTNQLSAVGSWERQKKGRSAGVTGAADMGRPFLWRRRAAGGGCDREELLIYGRGAGRVTPPAQRQPRCGRLERRPRAPRSAHSDLMAAVPRNCHAVCQPHTARAGDQSIVKLWPTLASQLIIQIAFIKY